MVQSCLNPVREPTPLPDPIPDIPETDVDNAPDEPVSGVPDALHVSSNFRFVQASELDNSEASTEWVDKNDVPEAEVNGVSEQEPNGAPDVEVVEVSILYCSHMYLLTKLVARLRFAYRLG